MRRLSLLSAVWVGESGGRRVEGRVCDEVRPWKGEGEGLEYERDVFPGTQSSQVTSP